MQKPCAVAHPGICQTRDRGIMPYLNRFLFSFHSAIMAAEEGAWFDLTAKVGDVIYFNTVLLLLHKRLRMPKVALFGEATNINGHIALSVTLDGFGFTCSTMLARACVTPDVFAVGKPNPSIMLARLTCSNIRDVLHSVTLESKEEPRELWLARARPKPKPKMDVLAHIAAGFEALAPTPKRLRKHGGGNGDDGPLGHGVARLPRAEAVRDVVPPPEEVAASCPDEFGECARGDIDDHEDLDDEDNDLNAAHTLIASAASKSPPAASARPSPSSVVAGAASSSSSSAPASSSSSSAAASSSSSSALASSSTSSGVAGAPSSSTSSAPASSSSSSAVPAPASSSDKAPHVPWWLTRTGRTAKCSSCGNDILAHEARVLFQPDKATVKGLKVWRDVWWRYYHLGRKCIPADADDLDEHVLRVDFAFLPARMKESVEQYREAREQARAKFIAEFPHRSGRVVGP